MQSQKTAQLLPPTTARPDLVHARRSLVVIVPAFNEAQKIQDTLRALRTIEPSCVQHQLTLSLYVVNDGSKDDTGSLALQAGADRVVQHKLNQGLGAAVRSGLVAAHTDGADIVVKFDADLQHDPNDVLDLLRPILEDEADIV